MVASLASENVLAILCVHGLADGPGRVRMFRGELMTLPEAVLAAEKKEFSVRQAEPTLTPHCPQRRPEVGGPGTMDLLYVEDEIPRPSDGKRL